MKEIDLKLTKEFERDILKIMEVCMENDSDNVTLTKSFKNYEVEIEMNFKILEKRG